MSDRQQPPRTVPRKKKHRIDSLDLESLHELKRSRAWVLVMARLQKLEDQGVALLIAGDPNVNADNVRGQIGAFRTVKLIPDMLIQEGKANHGHSDEQDA